MRLQGWVLWEDSGGCPHVRQSQFHLAPREICHWLNLGQSGSLGAPLWKDWRKGKKCCAAAPGETSDNMWENTSVNEEGEERPQTQEYRFPFSLWRSMVEQVSTLQSSLCQSKLCRKLQPVQSPCWSKFQAEPVILWDLVNSWRIAPHGKDSRWSCFWRAETSGKDPC